MAVNVGKGGRFRSNFHVDGFKRSDPGPSAIRNIKGIKNKRKAVNRIMRKALEPMRREMTSGTPVKKGANQASFRIM